MDSPELRGLGWKASFEQQLSAAETDEVIPARVAAHFGSHLLLLTVGDEHHLPVSQVESHDPQSSESCQSRGIPSGDLAVGDWILLERETLRGVRRLERESLLSRKAAGERVQRQLIAANLDTLFIVSSCNLDFNLSRLERYLALAIEADVTPIVVLTKSDLCADPAKFEQEVLQLKPDLVVETIDARDAEQTSAALGDWCGPGKTAALVGSSGVGKSTLAMSLGTGELATQGIREDDSRGRHTTTARCIHRLKTGGMLIDTPGMRELQLADCESGVSQVFDEIERLADDCRFRDCTHSGEPGCAVQAAIDQGDLPNRRLRNYQKLQSEQARNSKSLREQRHESRKLGKFYKSVLKSKRQSRQYDT